jgi:glycosyltransferase involved in cell wall biosynthesis
VLLQALALLRDDGMSSLSLGIVGDGNERGNLAALAATLGVAQSVHFYGESEAPWELLLDAGVAVCCSDSESAPNFVMEAMARAVPVVATAVGGTAELVDDGRTGLLVPADNPQRLADAISKLVTGADAEEMGASGRRRIELLAGQGRVDTLLAFLDS